MQTVAHRRFSPRKGLIIAAVLLGLMALTVALTPVISPLFLYLPTHDEEARQALLLREDVEAITVESGGAELAGYFLHAKDGPAPLVLYFNGNHENASKWMLETASTPERLEAFSGCHIAQLDYPSYGLSEGDPSADSYRAMALDVYDALSARADVTKVIVLGYSIGTGPAHYCAANRPVAGLILLAPYASGLDLFNNIVPIFHGPLTALVPYDMPSIEYAAEITVRPLVFATPKDSLVPYESTLALAELYPAGCTLVTVEGVNHKGFIKTESVLSAIGDYITLATAPLS